jgi:arylformamidase
MKWIDISMPLGLDTPSYPGDPAFQQEFVLHLRRGDQATVSRLVMSAHTGTHVDAPSHFIAGGAGIDQIALEQLCGPCTVLDLRGHDRIDVAQIAAAELTWSRVLLRTDNSTRGWQRPFRRDHVALTPAAARLLCEGEVKLVGIDGLSVDPFSENGAHPVHDVLLSAGVAVVEGLVLDGVEPGTYSLVVAPLRVVGAEAAPARAMIGRQT